MPPPVALCSGQTISLSTVYSLQGCLLAAWQAASASSQISSLFRSGGDYDSSAAAIDRNGRRAETLALVLLTGTVVSAVAGVIALRWKAAAP